MMDYVQTVNRSREYLIKVGPDIVLALVILIIGILVAIFTKRMSVWIIKKITNYNKGKFFYFINPAILNTISTLISRITFWTTIIIFIVLSAKIFGVDVFNQWVNVVTSYIPNLFSGLIILTVGIIISKLIREFVYGMALSSSMNNPRNFSLFFYMVTLLITILVAIKQVGIEIEFVTSVLLVSIGCILFGGTISFGLGSAPLVTNILSSYFLKKNLNQGQQIQFMDISGEIIELSPTSVVIQSKDGKVVIPAKKFNESEFIIKNVRTN